VQNNLTTNAHGNVNCLQTTYNHLIQCESKKSTPPP